MLLVRIIENKIKLILILGEVRVKVSFVRQGKERDGDKDRRDRNPAGAKNRKKTPPQIIFKILDPS